MSEPYLEKKYLYAHVQKQSRKFKDINHDPPSDRAGAGTAAVSVLWERGITVASEFIDGRHRWVVLPM